MSDGRRWKLCREFTYHIGSKNSQDYIHVPAGFITDFASVPWIFRMIIPKRGKYGKAAVVHDYLYQYHKQVHMLSGVIYTREQADQIFYQAMIVSGTKKWKAKVMYLAVRWFGWLVWNK